MNIIVRVYDRYGDDNRTPFRIYQGQVVVRDYVNYFLIKQRQLIRDRLGNEHKDFRVLARFDKNQFSYFETSLESVYERMEDREARVHFVELEKVEIND